MCVCVCVRERERELPSVAVLLGNSFGRVLVRLARGSGFESLSDHVFVLPYFI